MPGYNEGDTEFTPAGANGALGQWVDAISEERSSFGGLPGFKRRTTRFHGVAR